MPSVENILVRFGLDTASLQRDLDKFSRSVSAKAKSLQKIGGSLTKNLSLPVGIASAAVVKLGADFDRELAQISTLIPGQTKRVVEWKTEIQDLALAHGKSTSDIVAGAYDTISAYGDSAEAVGILETSVLGAGAAGATTKETLNLLSAVTKGYGDVSLRANKRVADLAFGTVRLGQTTLPQLSAGMQTVVSTAEMMGVSQEELFAIMATGTGVIGGASEVATSLRSALVALDKPTKDLSALMKAQGYETGKAWIEGEGLQKVMLAIKEESERTGKSLSFYTRRVEANQAVNLLASSSVDVYSSKLSELENASGELLSAVNAQRTGVGKLPHTFGLVRSSAQVLAQSLGGVLGDTLSSVLGPAAAKMTKIVRGLRDRLAKMHPATKAVITVVTALAVAAGPLVAATGALLALLPAVVSGMGLLAGSGLLVNAAFLPITATTLAVAAAGYLLWKNWETITAFMNKTFAPQLRVLGETFNDVKNTISIAAKKTFEAITWYWGKIQPIVTRYFTGVLNMAKGVWEAIKLAIKVPLDVVLGYVRIFSALFRGDWAGAMSAAGDMAKNIWDSIKGFFIRGVDAILGVLEAWLGWIPGFGDKLTAAREAIAVKMKSIAEKSVDAQTTIIHSAQAEEVQDLANHGTTLANIEAENAGARLQTVAQNNTERVDALRARIEEEKELLTAALTGQVAIEKTNLEISMGQYRKHLTNTSSIMGTALEEQTSKIRAAGASWIQSQGETGAGVRSKMRAWFDLAGEQTNNWVQKIGGLLGGGAGGLGGIAIKLLGKAGPWGAAITGGLKILNMFGLDVQDIVGGIKKAFSSLASFVGGVFKKIGKGIKGIWGGIKGLFGGKKKRSGPAPTNTFTGVGGPGATIPVNIPAGPMTPADYERMYSGAYAGGHSFGSFRSGGVQQNVTVQIGDEAVARATLRGLPAEAKITGVAIG